MHPIVRDLLVSDGDLSIGDKPWGLELLRLINKDLDETDVILPQVKISEVLKTIEGMPKGTQFRILTREIRIDDPETERLAELIGLTSDDAGDMISWMLGLSGAAFIGILFSAAIMATLSGDWKLAVQLIDAIRAAFQ
jgi:hypothetical protein